MEEEDEEREEFVVVLVLLLPSGEALDINRVACDWVK